MATKTIPLDGGLVVNADAEELDSAYSTDLINVSLDKPGTLSIRPGIGDSHSLDPDLNISRLYRWSDKITDVNTESEPLWIAISNVNGQTQILYTANTNPQNFTLLFSYAEPFNFTTQILDLGGSLRVLRGLNNPSVFIDRINRSFFGGEIPFSGLYADEINSLVNTFFVRTLSSVAGGSLDDGFVGDVMYYYYKLAPVYDGYQIGALSTSVPKKMQVNYGATNKTARLVFDIEKDGFNPRISHINLYRATSANVDSYEGLTYYLVKSISTTLGADDLVSTGELVGPRRVFATGQSNINTLAFSDSTTINQNANLGTQTEDIFEQDILITGLLATTGDEPLSSDTDFSEENITSSLLAYYIPPAGTNLYQAVPTWIYKDDNTDGTKIHMLSTHPDIMENYTNMTWKSDTTSGQHFRTIKSVGADFVVTTKPFLFDETPANNVWDYDSHNPLVSPAYANYGWSAGTSPEYVHAIIKSKNKVIYGNDLRKAYDIGRNVGRHDGGGTLSFQYLDYNVMQLAPARTGSRLEMKSNGSSGGTVYWDEHYQHQLLGADNQLKQGKWYYITFTTRVVNTPNDSNPKVGVRLTKSTHDGTVKFLSLHQHSFQDANGTIAHYGAWYYHADSDTDDSSNAYYVSYGCVDPNENTAHFGSSYDRYDIGDVGIFECLARPGGQGYFGSNVITYPTGTADTGDIVQLGNQQFSIADQVSMNTNEMFLIHGGSYVTQFDEFFGGADGGFQENYSEVTFLSQYTVDATSDPLKLSITVNDTGFMDTAPHQIHDTSVQTKYKFAKMISGRLFAGNVVIQSNDVQGNVAEEKHPNWIMFSELNNPDVIPVTNYIAISEIGDGEITYIDEISGSLVVFSHNSIFRLNVPSYDPMQWSLMEAVKSIGCSAPEGILTVQDSTYFCAKDNLYVMNSNFSPQPISFLIQDIYLENYTDKIKLYHEPIRNILYVIFENREVYSLDLNKKDMLWQRICYQSSFTSDNNPKNMVLDEQLNTYLVFNDKISKLGNVQNQEENHSFLKSTGWMKLIQQDKSVMLRKLHIRYKSNIPLKFVIHTDHDCESDHVNQKDKPGTYLNDNVSLKGTNSQSAGTPLVVPSNCDSSGIVEVSQEIGNKKALLNYTERLGVRCHSFKLTIMTDDVNTYNNAVFCEIYNIEVEYE